jgi:M6 family metalloprotease-like protein
VPAPFVDEPFTFLQPDRSEIHVRGWGNQSAAVFETPDGHTVALDPETGYYHYADLSGDGTELVPTGPRVDSTDPADVDRPTHLRASRSSAAARRRSAEGPEAGEPTPGRRWEQRRQARRASRRGARAGTAAPAEPAPTGQVVGLCLLVQFPDVPGAIGRQAVDDFCNAPGHTGFGNNGSVRDYFLEVSGGNLDYRIEVAAYYTAAHPRAYYTDETQPNGKRARELIREALDALLAGGFDPEVLSADAGGSVYALNVFYAGTRVNNWSKGLWPHSWYLDPVYDASPTRTFHDYQITDMGSSLTLRTFCHENGHMVCDFPDLYDYDSVAAGAGYGVGHYCLMCYGGSDTNPVHVSAYLKNEAGWAATLTEAGLGEIPLRAGENDFVVHRRDDDEYFVLENRRRTGRDAWLPDEGLVIWHVDEAGSNSFEQMTASQHYELSLEQADGRFDLEKRVNAGDTGDLYGGPAATSFGEATTPDSRWWDGTPSGLEISDISAPGEVVTLKLGPAPDPRA